MICINIQKLEMIVPRIFVPDEQKEREREKKEMKKLIVLIVLVIRT